MKKFSLYFGIAALSLGLLSACDDDDNGGEILESGYGDVSNIINTYVDAVVLPTYKNMKDEAWNLYEAVEALNEEDGWNDANITAACAAWRATRVPWEQSESFLFGPAELQNLDPLIDSWPLDKNGIDAVLNGGNFDSEALGATVRGFHTVEYLLFEDGQPRTTLLGKDHLEYLTVVTAVLRDDCIKLWSSWAGEDALEGRDAEAMEEAEYSPQNYAFQFKNAGKAGSTYMSLDEAIDDIINGCMDIASEVGAQKIGGPNGLAIAGNIAQAVLEVESWYSWNSITDYANNIESIQNAYFGGRGLTTSGTNSLSAFVRSQDAAMDAAITAAIKTAYDAIKTGMKQPFRNNLTGAEVNAAMNACAELEISIEKVKSLKK